MDADELSANFVLLGLMFGGNSPILSPHCALNKPLIRTDDNILTLYSSLGEETLKLVKTGPLYGVIV